jgi:2-dehydropantoate 2-reductase
MRVAVLGPGALGCLLAGRLAEAGEDTVLLDRDPDRAAEIRDRGIVIESQDGTRMVSLDVATGPSGAGEVDLLIVAVKAYDTASAMDQWTGCLSGAGTVLTVQNGLGNVEAILDAVPDRHVVGGITGEGATGRGPGRTYHAGAGETFLAAARGGKEAVAGAAAPLGRAGFRVHVEDDLDRVIWTKLLTNVGVNGLAGILGVRNGELLEAEGAREVMRDLIGEAATVAERKGVVLPDGDPRARAEGILRRTAENVNSLLQDLRAGRRTEVDYLNGKVVEHGDALGVPTPVNRTIWAMVRAMEG